MLFSEWWSKNEGKQIDYNSSDSFKGECVDLIKSYIKNVLGINPKSIGGANQYWLKYYKESYLYENFDIVSDNTPPIVGDVFIRISGGGGNGHIGVCTGEIEGEIFYACEQNYLGSKRNDDPAAIRPTGKYTSSDYHFLRPKNRENIDNLNGSSSNTPKNNNNSSSIKYEEYTIYNYKGEGKILYKTPIYKTPSTEHTYFTAFPNEKFTFLGMSKDEKYWYGINYGLCNSTVTSFIPRGSVDDSQAIYLGTTETLNIYPEEFM